ncbi:MAG: hypothetical protein AABW99_00310 [archaeon]
MDRAEFLRKIRELRRTPVVKPQIVNGTDYGMVPNFTGLIGKYSELRDKIKESEEADRERQERSLEFAYLGKIMELHENGHLTHQTREVLKPLIANKFLLIINKWGYNPALRQMYLRTTNHLKKEIPKPPTKPGPTPPAPKLITRRRKK